MCLIKVYYVTLLYVSYLYYNSLFVHMTKKAGERLQIGEAKTAIILYLLKNKEYVSEPDIRKYLFGELDLKNQGTINGHLRALLKLECIESVTQGPNKNTNYWNITSIKSLKRIRHEFPDIHINSYEKSIMILFNERGYNIKKMENLDFYIKLLLSVSLFDAFLDNDINELLTKASKIYLRDEGYMGTKNYEYHSEQFFKLHEKANTGFKIPVNFSIYRRHLSKEDFFKIFEIFQEQTEEIIKELEEAYKIYKKFDEDLDNKPSKILLNHFINHDVFKGIELPDERGFLIDLKESRHKAWDIYFNEGNLENYERYHELISLQELEVYSEIIKKYKQPSIFYISEDPQKIQSFLEDFYKDQIL
jgi:hypothetical protein